jgi:hypothetical protein
MISILNTVAAREIAEDFARRALGRHATQKRDERPADQAASPRAPLSDRPAVVVAHDMPRRTRACPWQAPALHEPPPPALAADSA